MFIEPLELNRVKIQAPQGGILENSTQLLPISIPPLQGSLCSPYTYTVQQSARDLRGVHLQILGFLLSVIFFFNFQLIDLPLFPTSQPSETTTSILRSVFFVQQLLGYALGKTQKMCISLYMVSYSQESHSLQCLLAFGCTPLTWKNRL